MHQQMIQNDLLLLCLSFMIYFCLFILCLDADTIYLINLYYYVVKIPVNMVSCSIRSILQHQHTKIVDTFYIFSYRAPVFNLFSDLLFSCTQYLYHLAYSVPTNIRKSFVELLVLIKRILVELLVPYAFIQCKSYYYYQ